MESVDGVLGNRSMMVTWAAAADLFVERLGDQRYLRVHCRLPWPILATHPGARVARVHELDDVAEAASLLLGGDGAVVALHGFGRMPADRASDEISHLRRGRGRGRSDACPAE